MSEQQTRETQQQPQEGGFLSGLVKMVVAIVSVIGALFGGLFGSLFGGNDNERGGGGFLSSLFKMFSGSSPEPSRNSPAANPTEPEVKKADSPNLIERAWKSTKETVSGAWESVTSYFSKNTDHLASKVAGNKAAMYVQADDVVKGKGAVGRLVLIDDNGNKEVFNFTSGPWGKGALPGLLSTDCLASANPKDNKPVTSYSISAVHHNIGDKRFATTDGGTDFFVKLDNPELEGRSGFGIHPNRNNNQGNQVGTLGCIGMDDESAKRFNSILKGLEARGVTIKKLDVFQPGQNADAIELAHMGVANAGTPSKTRS